MSTETPVDSQRPSAPTWLVALIASVAVAVVTAMAFNPVTGFGLLEHGDAWLLGAHDRWRGFADGRLGWMLETTRGGAWRPVLWASFGLDDALGGTPDVLHRTSWLLHAAGAAAVCWAVHAVLTVAGPGTDRRRIAWMASIAAALLWALHPLRSESVAWISARGDVLATLFLALAAFAWIRAIEGPTLRRGPLAATAVLVSLAAASDPAACGAPAALFALGLWVARSMPGSRAARGLGAPLAIVSIPALVVLVVDLARLPPGPGFDALPAALSAAHRIVAPLRDSILAGSGHAGRGAPDGFPDTLPAAAWVDAATMLVLAVCATVALARSRGFGLAALAYMGFVGTRALLVREPFGADREAHLATIPFFVALAVLVTSWRPWIGIGASILLCAFILAEVRTLDADLVRWKDSRSLWMHALDADPGNDAACSGLGEAALHDPAGPRRVEAEEWFRASLARHGWRPRAHGAYGALQLDGGDARVAALHLRIAMEQAPWLPEPPYHLGVLLRRLGEHADAGAALVRATQLDAESAPAWFQLGLARRSSNDRDGAAQALRRAVLLAPDEARYAEELKTVE